MRDGMRQRPLSIRSGNGSTGFTLLEVLVALTLLAVIAACLYGTYFSIFRAKETTLAGMEERRAVRETLGLMRKELAAAWYLQANKKTAFVVEDRDQFGKPASRLSFATIAPPVAPGQPFSDQLAVAYGVTANGDTLTLNRSASDLYRSGNPLVYPQMEVMEGFLVECSSDGTKWVKSWDTAINFNLPKMVRITLQVREGDQVVGYSTLAIVRMAGS